MELVDRLLTRQKAIEQTLAQRHLKEGHLVLYDITRPAVATSGIPVVGLGGSAGALDPLKAFFEAIPPTAGRPSLSSSTWPPPTKAY